MIWIILPLLCILCAFIFLISIFFQFSDTNCITIPAVNRALNTIKLDECRGFVRVVLSTTCEALCSNHGCSGFSLVIYCTQLSLLGGGKLVRGHDFVAATEYHCWGRGNEISLGNLNTLRLVYQKKHMASPDTQQVSCICDTGCNVTGNCTFKIVGEKQDMTRKWESLSSVLLIQ